MAALTVMAEAPGLSEITDKANAKTAVVTVVVKRPHIAGYTYNAQGQQREGYKLQCILQCENPAEYCVGVAKLQNRDRGELQKLLETVWKENSTWKLTEIALHKDKAAYIHTNVRVSVDLRRTKRTAVLQTVLKFPPAPEPAKTIADILQVTETLRFDLMVLIREIISERTSQQGLKIMDVRVIDDSRINEEYATLPLTMFFRNASEADDFKKHAAERTPVNLMCLQGTYKDSQLTVAPVKDQSWVQAAAGKRCEALVQQAEKLLTNELAVKDVAALNENPPSGQMDYNAEPATLMVASLLDPNGAFVKESLGEENQKVYQLNMVHWPPPTQDDSITTKDGQRLFASSVEISDWSGRVTLAARGKAMLQAAALDYCTESEAMEEYQRQLQNGEVRHPVLCSMRVKVEVRPAAKEQDASGETQAPSDKAYNAIIVETARADLNDWPPIPNDAVESLHTLLSLCQRGSDRLLAIPLSKLQPAAFSSVAANLGDDKPVPLEKCLAMLYFTKPTNGKQHPTGIRVVGEKVRDATAEGTDSEKFYGTVALSSFARSGDFHINEGGTTVLAVISRVSAPTTSALKHEAELHIEAVQRLPQSQEVLRKAAHVMRQMQSIASTRKTNAGSSDEDIKRAGKCRRLMRWPTNKSPETPETPETPAAMVF